MLHGLISRRHRQITHIVVVRFIGLLLMISTTGLTQADTIRLADGLAVTPEYLQQLTVDVAYRQQADSNKPGLRISLPPVFDEFVLFADATSVNGVLDNVALGREVDHSGRGEGIGVYITGLPDWGRMSTTLRLAYHRERTDVDNTLAVAGRQATVERDLRTQSLAVLLSPNESWQDNGTNTYVALGLTNSRERQDLFVDNIRESQLSDSESNINPYVAVGIVYPWQRFRLYAVIDYEETASLSLGVRYLASQTAVHQTSRQQ